MKILAVLALVLLTGCALQNNSHRPECKFTTLKQGERLPNHCGDWGNPGSTIVTVRPSHNGTYVVTK